MAIGMIFGLSKIAAGLVSGISAPAMRKGSRICEAADAVVVSRKRRRVDLAFPQKRTLTRRSEVRICASPHQVRVEVDLLRPLPTSVFVGAEDENMSLNCYVQKIEWENVPKYCKHCRKIGHSLINCWIVEKKKREENEKKKEEAGEAQEED
ncbi:PREDICTED: uncharacterized protein LOC109215779 [Nicotiana attenuata]|uniref:uncharacterized protein LOC109215779 n=1 Tax=Nicotiana attenuata TaxID=49451 RepID=UPI000904D9AA|nr:PREDICTED: uncharacterized protein LOC109215779 [Nicotiana attenuata]